MSFGEYLHEAAQFFNFSARRAEELQAERVALSEEGYWQIPLEDFVYHWASMGTQVPATPEVLNQRVATIWHMQVVPGETVLQKGQYAMEQIYEEVSLVQSGDQLWVRMDKPRYDPTLDFS